MVLFEKSRRTHRLTVPKCVKTKTQRNDDGDVDDDERLTRAAATENEDVMLCTKIDRKRRTEIVHSTFSSVRVYIDLVASVRPI